MSVDFRAISAKKVQMNPMKTTYNRKIPSILMIGSEHQLLFNFPKMKFLPLLGPDKEILKFLRGKLPLPHNVNLNHDPNNPNNNSLHSNNNPNSPNVPLLPAFVILLCLIVLLSNLLNKVELWLTFSILLAISNPSLLLLPLDPDNPPQLLGPFNKL